MRGGVAITGVVEANVGLWVTVRVAVTVCGGLETSLQLIYFAIYCLFTQRSLESVVESLAGILVISKII